MTGCRRNRRLAAGVLAAVLAGCGTTRTTDTTRAASEMMLVSQAVDTAVARIDFSALGGKTVFLDTQYLDGTVDKGYLVSTLRQHLLAHGALLQEDRQRAVYVVEPRSGAVGTDKHSLLVGTPQMSLPAVVPGIPTAIPELALVKKTDQKGVAKLAVFAYNRMTGRALWQSGPVESDSTLKDTWVFGAGPFSRGTIHQGTELAGEKLPALPVPFAHPTEAPPDQSPSAIAQAAATQPQAWANADAPAPPQLVPFALLGLTGAAAAVDHPLILPNPQNPPPHAGPTEPPPLRR